MKRSFFPVALLALALAVGCGGEGNQIGDRRIVERLDEGDRVNTEGKYSDRYWFRALETGDAIVNIDASEFNPQLTVLDEDNHQVVTDDDGGAGDDARATFRVAFGKRYQIVVSSSTPAETGRYYLTVSSQLIFDSIITRGDEPARK